MNPTKIAIVSVISVAVIVGGYFIWKKLSDKKKREQAIAQSKATVTGVMNVLSANIKEGFDMPPADDGSMPPPPMPVPDVSVTPSNGPGFSNSPLGMMLGNISPADLVKMDLYNNLINAMNPAINFFTPNAPNCIPQTDARSIVANQAIKAANALRAPFTNPGKFDMNDEVVMNYYATIPIAAAVFMFVTSGMNTGVKVVKSGDHASGLLVTNPLILSNIMNPITYIQGMATLSGGINPAVLNTVGNAAIEFGNVIASFIDVPQAEFRDLVKKISITPTEYEMLQSKFQNALSLNKTTTIPVSVIVSGVSCGVYSAISTIPNVSAMDLCAILLSIVKGSTPM